MDVLDVVFIRWEKLIFMEIEVIGAKLRRLVLGVKVIPSP